MRFLYQTRCPPDSHYLWIGRVITVVGILLSIGATIGLIGLVILLYGLFGHADYNRSDGININLWWGLLMVVFGLLMSIGGYISSRRSATH